MAAQTHPEAHFAILQLGVSIWNQWRASEPLTVPDLQNADLRGFYLENINLCRADLRNANLSKSYLYEADFQEADLRNANLTRAGLIGANLHGANLSGAIIKQAYLAQSDLSNANFTDAHLQKADFQAARLTKAVFVNAQVAEARFTTSFDLTRAQIARARGTHLACFDAVLSGQLGLPPQGLADGLTDGRTEALAELNALKADHSIEVPQLLLAPETKLEPITETVSDEESEPKNTFNGKLTASANSQNKQKAKASKSESGAHSAVSFKLAEPCEGDPLCVLQEILSHYILPSEKALEEIKISKAIDNLLAGATITLEGKMLVDNEPNSLDSTFEKELADIKAALLQKDSA